MPVIEPRPARMPPVLAWTSTLAMVVFVTACTTSPPAPPAADQQAERQRAHLAAISGLVNWRLRARTGVQRDDQGFSADLNWRQSDNNFDVRVVGPLNSGSFALRGDDSAVTLTLPDGTKHQAATAEALMNAHLSWAIPVSGARFWVRGIPAPSSTATQQLRDDSGRWTDFAQDGWRISVLDYRLVDGLQLPRKLFFSRDSLQVRLVVKEWELR
jgi:outer membrane lipoprotein LolB